MDNDPLDIDPETMRQLGYQTVDWLVQHAVSLRDEHVLRQASPAEMADRIPVEAPRVGADLAVILDELAADVLPYRSRIDHPRYLATSRAPGPGRVLSVTSSQAPTTSTSATGWSPPVPVSSS